MLRKENNKYVFENYQPHWTPLGMLNDARNGITGCNSFVEIRIKGYYLLLLTKY